MAYDNASKATAHASTTYDVQTRKVIEATNWESDCSTKYSTKVGDYESASTSSTASKEKSDYLVSSYSKELVVHVDNLTKTTEKSKTKLIFQQPLQIKGKKKLVILTLLRRIFL